MDAEVQPRRCLESQGDEKYRTAEVSTPHCTLRLKASHVDQVVDVAEEELAIHVEYFDAQLRLLHLERSQRAGSLEISTFREYADSFEFEEELLVENDQCPGLQNGLQDYATKRRSSETEGHEMQQISKRSCSSSSEEVEVEECLLEEPYSEGIDSEGLDSEGLDSEHPFNRDAKAIIPRINSGNEAVCFGNSPWSWPSKWLESQPFLFLSH